MRDGMGTGSTTFDVRGPTVDASGSVRRLVAVTAISVVLAVGTGGVATPRAARQDGTNCLARFDPPALHGDAQNGDVMQDVTVGERLTAIRSNFQLNTIELAKVLRVTRQTIYDWNAERQTPQPNSLERLRALCSLSRKWRESIGADTETVHRKFADKAELIAALTTENLDSRTEEAVLGIARTRSSVRTERKSITETLRERGFRPASKSRQDEAIANAGR